jgi:hypothetical protein
MKILILIHRRKKRLKFCEIIVNVYDVNFFGYVFGLKVFFFVKNHDFKRSLLQFMIFYYWVLSF